MSTILEALKKSEQERRLNQVPTLSDMPTPREAAKWPLVVLAILVLVLAIILMVLIVKWWSPVATEEGTPIKISNESLGLEQTESPTSAEKIVVNVVSYSDTPGQSFTMINGQLYREGEFVRAGLKVEKIESNRVILNLRGQRIIRTP